MLCVCSINVALNTETLAAGDASKLAGQLSWSCTSLFKRMGRAMLRPIFDQQTRWDGAMNNELRRSLRWWCEILVCGICETRGWSGEPLPVVHLFCDASGVQKGLGAVLAMDGRFWHTARTAPENLLRCFQRRNDNQIMGLELLSISLGLSAFGPWLQGRRVVIQFTPITAAQRFVRYFGCVLVLL